MAARVDEAVTAMVHARVRNPIDDCDRSGVETDLDADLSRRLRSQR
jgi:hypothetical protein